MRLRSQFHFILALFCLAACASTAGAKVGTTTIRLTATRATLMADGKQTTEIRAYVQDSGGRPVTGLVEVQFSTTAGTLSTRQAQTFSGVATVRLTSSPIPGPAKVTAFTTSGGSADVDLYFTDDPQATFMGNAYMSLSGTGYLTYSATDRVIEAQGKNGGAKVTYRNIEITADRLQLRCEDSILRAHDNITVKRGTHVFKASRLYFNMQTGQGYAIAEIDRKLKPVVVSGEQLKVEVSPTFIPSSYMLFPPLQVKLIIVARSITYFPNDRLQFRGPRFYQDQQQILKLPYYELPLYSNELFSDQFISVGTSGFGLELPFYYDLTPRSTGIFFIRHQQRLGRGYYATDPGWSLDLVQGYSAQGSRRYEGAFGFTGLTRSDWSFRWQHSQEFNTASQGTFFLDFPHHDSVFSSTNFNQQSKAIRWGMNFSAGQTFTGPASSSTRTDAYIETQPRPLSRTYLYTFGTTLTTGRIDTPDFKDNETTQNLSLRAFSRPQHLDKRTTLTNSFTLGHLWTSTGHSGPLGLATLSLDRTLVGGGALNLTYDMVFQPQTFDFTGGHHRLGVTYTLGAGKRFQASLFGSAFLDASDSSLLADFSYRLNRQWRLLASATLQKFAGESYNDLEFTIGRRIGAREVQLTYSTLNHRLSFDLTATRF